MEIESKISVKKSNGEVVSADVMLYNDTGDVVKRITIIDSEVLQSLEGEIEAFESTYASIDAMNKALANEGNLNIINATKINGNNASDYAKLSNIPSSLEPTSHASNTTKYGLGDQYKYGHVKIRNDLSASSLIAGEVLSSRQGGVLNERLTTAENTLSAVSSREKINSLYLKMGRASDREGLDSDRLAIPKASKVLIKGYSTDDGFDWNGKRVTIYINGAFYDRTMSSDGECEFQLNLDKGDYLMTVFTGGKDDRNGCMAVKKIMVS